MEATDQNILTFLFAFAQGWLTPFMTTVISIVYFTTSPRTQSILPRLLASAHGLSIAVLYLCALSVHWVGKASPDYEMPFYFLSLLPLFLIIGSFFLFRGRKLIHLLQIPNLLCLLWTFFVGSMAVTGNWL